MTITRHQTGPRMSQAVAYGGLVFLAGQVDTEGPADTVSGQTANILARIDRVLAEAGSDKSRLLSATIWITDMSKFDEMNAVWDGWVVPGHTPARATVEARLAAPKYLVEIAVVAAAG